MRTRSFGDGTSVSELALGTWGLSGDGYGPVAEAVQDEVLQRARAYGITLYETADAYGRGAMEQRLGRLFESDAEVRIVTKVGTDVNVVPARRSFSPEYLRRAVQQSGERLRRSRLDVVLLHNPSAPTLEREEVTGVLAELKKEGVISSWGVSAGSLAVARAALARGAEVLELAYNVYNGMELEALDFGARNVGVLARSVLAHGLLCGQWPETKVFPSGDHRAERWTHEQLRGRLRQLSVVSSVLGGDVQTPRAAALRFVLQNRKVTSAVIGPRSRVQLDQLVRDAGQGPEYLPNGSVERIKEQFARMGVSR